MSPPPITSAEIPDAWIATLKGVSNLAGIRAHPTLPRIQVRGLATPWGDLMLYSSTWDFVSIEERDAALGRLR